MSVSVVYLPSAYTRPMAIPATAALIGTPASMRASEPEHTDASRWSRWTRHLGHEAQGVVEVLKARQHRQQGTGGERAVSDLAALGDPTRPVSPLAHGAML